MKEKEEWAMNYAVDECRLTGHRPDIAGVWLAGFHFAKEKCKRILDDTPHARFRIDPIGENETGSEPVEK